MVNNKLISIITILCLTLIMTGCVNESKLQGKEYLEENKDFYPNKIKILYQGKSFSTIMYCSEDAECRCSNNFFKLKI